MSASRWRKIWCFRAQDWRKRQSQEKLVSLAFSSAYSCVPARSFHLCERKRLHKRCASPHAANIQGKWTSLQFTLVCVCRRVRYKIFAFGQMACENLMLRLDCFDDVQNIPEFQQIIDPNVPDTERWGIFFFLIHRCHSLDSVPPPAYSFIL